MADGPELLVLPEDIALAAVGATPDEEVEDTEQGTRIRGREQTHPLGPQNPQDLAQREGKIDAKVLEDLVEDGKVEPVKIALPGFAYLPTRSRSVAKRVVCAST